MSFSWIQLHFVVYIFLFCVEELLIIGHIACHLSIKSIFFYKKITCNFSIEFLTRFCCSNSCFSIDFFSSSLFFHFCHADDFKFDAQISATFSFGTSQWYSEVAVFNISYICFQRNWIYRSDCISKWKGKKTQTQLKQEKHIFKTSYVIILTKLFYLNYFINRLLNWKLIIIPLQRVFVIREPENARKSKYLQTAWMAKLDHRNEIITLTRAIVCVRILFDLCYRQRDGKSSIDDRIAQTNKTSRQKYFFFEEECLCWMSNRTHCASRHHFQIGLSPELL